jgi:hypothetical protein
MDLGLHVKIEKRAMSDPSELRECNAIRVINHGCDDGTMTYMSKLGKVHAV